MQLSLYAYDACPHCQRVYRAIADLGIEVEKRDVLGNPEFRRELQSEVGRGTVPVLRIDDGEETRWIPESRDIVAWLYEREGRPPPRADLHRLATFTMWAMLIAGLFFPEYQLPLFIGALSIGAVRSIWNAVTTRAWTHAAIAAVFIFGAIAVTLRLLGIVDIPWWYGAYGLVAVLVLAMIVVRMRIARRQRS